MRAFLAVPADPVWVERAVPLAARLKSCLPRAAWTPRSAWHLTLKFLGEISGDAAGRFAEDVASIVEGARAMTLVPGGATVFPSRGRPRVLGLGFVPSADLQALESLAAAVEAAVRRAGAPPEERDFHAHVTLARLRDPWPVAAVEAFRREVGAWDLPPWTARSCVLYESRLGSAGAVHTPVRTFAFAGAREEVGA